MFSQTSAFKSEAAASCRAVSGVTGAVPAIIRLIREGDRPQRRANSAWDIPQTAKRSASTAPGAAA